MHNDQMPIDLERARALVEDQFPEWRGSIITCLPSGGTVNAIFRIGSGLAARFPLRAADPGAELARIRAEAAAMLELSEQCPFHTPLPVAIGHPTRNYPLELPPAGPDVMSHRDLIPANLLVSGGLLAGVLDGGDFAAADPALDLVAAWHLLDRGPREVLRSGLNAGTVEWQRGAAWAFQQSMGLVWYYRDSNPGMSALGRSTLQRILEDPAIPGTVTVVRSGPIRRQ